MPASQGFALKQAILRRHRGVPHGGPQDAARCPGLVLAAPGARLEHGDHHGEDLAVQRGVVVEALSSPSGNAEQRLA
eukprot:6188092-Lingulodinium_polyedra.AAC.1